MIRTIAAALMAASSAAGHAETDAFERMSVPAYRALVFDAGAAYRNGDYAKAFGGFQRAACAGDKPSQAALARMLVLGQGAQRNDELAYAWLVTAAESGLTTYRTLAQAIEQGMTPERRDGAARTAQALLEDYGTRATHMSCLRSDSSGGHIVDTVQCTPSAAGSGKLLVHRCVGEGAR